MASTPTSRIIQTIQAVERLETQLATLTAAVEHLASRLDAVETTARPQAPAPPS